MTHDVFISHSAVDKLLADAVCHGLEKRQIRCWIAPRDIPAGATWAGSIADAIAKSRIMLLIFSSHANTSEHVMREVGLAAENHVFRHSVDPAFLAGSDIPDSLQKMPYHRQTLKIYHVPGLNRV